MSNRLSRPSRASRLSRPRDVRLLPRQTSLRARLTLIYGGLFLVAGVLLLGVTYALFNQQFVGGASVKILSRATDGEGVLPGGDELLTRDPAGTSGELSFLDKAVGQRWAGEQKKNLQRAATASLITQGGIALLVVGGVAAGFGWLMAGRVLAPLHRVTDTARRIAAAPAADRGLHERIALRGPDDEVKELADSFDLMVERLDRSFDGQRRFVANASHELRTPLTLNRAMVEVAMHRRSASADVRQLGENLLEINARHERLITGLLLLASTENEITERHPVDLADVVEHVAAQTEPEAERAGVTVHQQADPAPAFGDAMLLERLVQNLVENGIRHNLGADAGGWVRVGSRVGADGTVEVEVSNTGPMVPPYEVPALFEPFRRLGSERLVTAKGAGLGLSIVRSVARAHGGQVMARPRESGGLVVCVTLPAAPGSDGDAGPVPGSGSNSGSGSVT